MSRAKGRPRRGNPDSNVLIEGDTGIFAGPLGGAEPGATESGDLAAREFGVPQADIPGGVRHVVNPQTRHRRPPGVPERPADYHKEHGVEPQDDGQYVVPPDATEEKADKAAPEPRQSHAVPVYIQQAPDSRPRIRTLVAEGPQSIPAATIDPVRIADRDPHRLEFWLSTESAAGSSASGFGAQTSVTAGQQIATTGALAAGTYSVTVQHNFIGAAASIDASNLEILVGGTLYVRLPNSDASEALQTFGPFTITVTAGQAITVNAVANGTAAIVYNDLIMATPIASGVRIGDWETTADGRGLLVPAGMVKDFKTQDSLHLVNEGSAAAVISWAYITEIEVAEAGPE